MAMKARSCGQRLFFETITSIQNLYIIQNKKKKKKKDQRLYELNHRKLNKYNYSIEFIEIFERRINRSLVF